MKRIAECSGVSASVREIGSHSKRGWSRRVSMISSEDRHRQCYCCVARESEMSRDDLWRRKYEVKKDSQFPRSAASW